MKIYSTIIIATLLLSSQNLTAQIKQEQAGAKEKQYQEKQKKQLKLIKDRTFIIEANMIYDKDLNTFAVSSTTNFVKVEKDDIIIQLTFDKVANWNGISGVTIEGEISDYTIQNEEGPITVVAKIASLTMGMSDLKMTVFDDGMARAVLSGTFGQRITFSGHFRAPDESTVFKGVSKY